MKQALLTTAVLTLLCVAVTIWAYISFDNTTNHVYSNICSLSLPGGWALALVSGVLSVVQARRLGRPGLAVLLAVVTLFALGLSCGGLNDIASHLEEAPPMVPGEAQADNAMIVYPLAVPALTALLSLRLSVAGSPRPMQAISMSEVFAPRNWSVSTRAALLAVGALLLIVLVNLLFGHM